MKYDVHPSYEMVANRSINPTKREINNDYQITSMVGNKEDCPMIKDRSSLLPLMQGSSSHLHRNDQQLFVANSFHHRYILRKALHKLIDNALGIDHLSLTPSHPATVTPNPTRVQRIYHYHTRRRHVPNSDEKHMEIFRLKKIFRRWKGRKDFIKQQNERVNHRVLSQRPLSYQSSLGSKNSEFFNINLSSDIIDIDLTDPTLYQSEQVMVPLSQPEVLPIQSVSNPFKSNPRATVSQPEVPPIPSDTNPVMVPPLPPNDDAIIRKYEKNYDFLKSTVSLDPIQEPIEEPVSAPSAVKQVFVSRSPPPPAVRKENTTVVASEVKRELSNQLDAILRLPSGEASEGSNETISIDLNSTQSWKAKPPAPPPRPSLLLVPTQKGVTSYLTPKASFEHPGVSNLCESIPTNHIITETETHSTSQGLSSQELTSPVHDENIQSHSDFRDEFDLESIKLSETYQRSVRYHQKNSLAYGLYQLQQHLIIQQLHRLEAIVLEEYVQLKYLHRGWSRWRRFYQRFHPNKSQLLINIL